VRSLQNCIPLWSSYSFISDTKTVFNFILPANRVTEIGTVGPFITKLTRNRIINYFRDISLYIAYTTLKRYAVYLDIPAGMCFLCTNYLTMDCFEGNV
jgi:hypothetical protein